MNTNYDKKLLHMGSDWQNIKKKWEGNTLSILESIKIAQGYLKIAKIAFNIKLSNKKLKGLDIGAGAGNLAAALSAYDIQMTASEWHKEGIGLLNRENPNIKNMLIDIFKFNDNENWDLIICRELYPFTRVSDFNMQIKLIYKLIKALKPNGILFFVASTAEYPNCMNYNLMKKKLKNDPNIKFYGGILEPLAKRLNFIISEKNILKLLNYFAEFFLAIYKFFINNKIATIRVYTVCKK